MQDTIRVEGILLDRGFGEARADFVPVQDTIQKKSRQLISTDDPYSKLYMVHARYSPDLLLSQYLVFSRVSSGS